MQTRFINNPLSPGLLLGAIFALAPVVSHAQSNLVRNGAFNDVLVDWTAPSALAGEPLYVHDAPGGHVNLHPEQMGYIGTLLRQNLNVPGIANQTMNASLDLRAVWPVMGHTIELSVEFSRDDGSVASAAVLTPDNSTIGDSSFTIVTGSYTFPANAVRLLAVTIDKVGEGNFDGDNISLTSSLVPETLPVLAQVFPTQVAYGNTVQIAGSDFGAVQGSVLIGDSDSGIAINSWSDTMIQVTVSDPCTGGAVTVVHPDEMRTSEQRDIGITSPYFSATRFRASGFDQELNIPITVPGQMVRITVDVDCHNNCAPAGGITFSVPEAPTALLHPANIAGDGGTRIGIDTSGLTPGLHTFTITSSAMGFAPRTFPLTIDVRNPGTPSLEYRDDSFNWLPLPNPFALTSQDRVPIRAMLLDDGGNDITQYVDLTFSTANSSVIQAWNSTAPWDDSVVMPQDNGSSTISVNGPGAINSTYPVTVTVPAHPKIVNYTISPTDTVIDNSGNSTFVISVTASQAMTGFSWNNPGGVVASVDSDFINGNFTYTATLKVNADVKPGTYRLDVSATIPDGGASRSKAFTVVNTPTTGMLTGYLALMRDPFFSHGATGTVEFYDPSTGLKSFERMLPWSESWDYFLPNIPAGTYKLRWRTEEGPGFPLPQWFGNIYDIADAEEVVITAGSTNSNMDFFLDLIPDMLSPVVSTFENQYNAGTGAFQSTVLTESGFAYEFWKSVSLKDGSWYKLPTAQSGTTTNSATFTDSTATELKAFYKIIRK